MTQISKLRTLRTGTGCLPWHAAALKLAVDLRRNDPAILKIEIARAVFKQIVGAPRNTENIRDWISGLEESGELQTRESCV